MSPFFGFSPGAGSGVYVAGVTADPTPKPPATAATTPKYFLEVF